MGSTCISLIYCTQSNGTIKFNVSLYIKRIYHSVDWYLIANIVHGHKTMIMMFIGLQFITINYYPLALCPSAQFTKMYSLTQHTTYVLLYTCVCVVSHTQHTTYVLPHTCGLSHTTHYIRTATHLCVWSLTHNTLHTYCYTPLCVVS